MAFPSIYNRPFRPLASVLRDMEENMDRMWRLGGRDLVDTESNYWLPAIDIKEEDNFYMVKADIPGVDAKDIKVSIDERNNLIIEGEKKVESKEEKKGYISIERSSGSFYRKITLPHLVNAEHIKAKHKNGVLEITIPKAKKSSTREINIES